MNFVTERGRTAVIIVPLKAINRAWVRGCTKGPDTPDAIRPRDAFFRLSGITF
jgi:hypothetical protein